jgi:hydrogenase-4 component F
VISAAALACLAALLVPAAAMAVIFAARSSRAVDTVARVSALLAAAAGAVLTVVGAMRAGHPATGSWYLVDGAGAVFVAVIAGVGLTAALASPAYLRDHRRAHTGALRSRKFYYAGLFGFWAALAAVPVMNNLAIAWLILEATTAASALLVAFSGSRNALEAGWKYLVLTSVGLTVALMGIVMLYATGAHRASGLDALTWARLARTAPFLPHATAAVAFCMIVAGMATKIGWAPVHNWLPDAHSEAPPPISALLSAALLPAVALVAWRVDLAVRIAAGPGFADGVFVAFGLASLAVAVPFLWKTLPWKRFLAYSSLEHMGVIALGIGFHNRWAVAGVLIHVAGHAIAKCLGFVLTIPLVRYQPGASTAAPRGIVRLSRPLGAGMGLSLLVLAAVPPSPLFVSEVLIVYAGIAAGQVAIAALVAVLLALGFLGIAHMTIEALSGRPEAHRVAGRRSAAWITRITVGAGIALAAVVVLAVRLPAADLARLMSGGRI